MDSLFFRKFFLLLSVTSILFGCKGKQQEPEEIHVALLRGPSAIAFAGWMENTLKIDGKEVRWELIDSPERMQAQLVKGEADLAVLPMSAAANLYNKGINYRTAGCPIWGTLYLAGRPGATDTPRHLLLFGAGTTPDILTRHYLQQHPHLRFEPNYTFSTPREVLQALVTGRADAALLSEPFLSIALKQDTTLQILADLNRSEQDSAIGFAQTAILLAPTLQTNVTEIDSLIDNSCRFVNANPAEAIRILEEKEVFAPGTIDPNSIRRCRIDYRTAGEASTSIDSFLRLIYEYEPKALGGKLPDKDFLITEE